MTSTKEEKVFGAGMRKDFMLREKSIFLNHGSFGSMPRCVHERQVRYLEEMESHPDVWFRYNIYKYLWKATEKVAEFMGIKPEDTFLTENVTKAANIVMKTFPLQPGQAILVTNLTYHAVKNTTDVTVSHVKGAKIYYMDIGFPITSEDSIVEQYDEYLTNHPDVKFTIIDHITSPTSIVMPVKRLVEVCRKYDVTVLIDGAHVPGQLNPDIQDIDADFYIGNLHKWLFTPRGCAVVWMNPNRKQDWFKPLVTSSWEGQSLFKQFSYEGTGDNSARMCAIDGIDYYQSLGGMEGILEYTTSLRKRAVTYLEERWRTTRIPIPDHMVAPNLQLIILPVIPFYSDHPEKYLRLQKLILQEFDVQTAVVGGQGMLLVRVSVQVYNTMSDFEALADAILQLQKRDDLEEVDKTIEL